jgi:PepSY-associated TM region
MSLAGAASFVHKWLALIVGVQMLFWMASGLFFALSPIDRVHGDHFIARAEPQALAAAELPAPQAIMALFGERPTTLRYERDVLGRAVAVAEFAKRRPALVELSGLRVISPLDEAGARAIATAHVRGAPRVAEARLVTEESPEYRDVLPAWRVAFADREGLAVYVAADTGRVTKRRSDLWRAFDALYALHIMDWRDHDNFNTGLLIAFSVTSLIVVLAGFVLFPYRLGWIKRRGS